MTRPRITRTLVALYLAIALAALVAGAAFADDTDDADNPNAPDTSAAVENDHDPTNVESTDDVGGDVADDVSRDSPTEYWEYLVTVLCILTVGAVNRAHWGTEARTLCMIVCGAAYGIGGAYLRGELDNWTFTSAAMAQIIGITWGAYNILSRTKGVSTLLAQWEAVTGGRPVPPAT